MTIRYYYRVDKYFEGRSRILVVLFFFFFFKQKTAYEMRISDWSSDVCSSDLQHNGGRWTLKNPWHPLFLNELTTIYQGASAMSFSQSPARSNWRRSPRQARQREPWQIGRAPRRERGCQCV